MVLALSEVLKTNGYKMLRSIPLNDSTHISFQRGRQSIVVNGFTNGRIQLSTHEGTRLLETFVPQLEEKLDVKFEHTYPKEKLARNTYKVASFNTANKHESVDKESRSERCKSAPPNRKNYIDSEKKSAGSVDTNVVNSTPTVERRYSRRSQNLAENKESSDETGDYIKEINHHSDTKRRLALAEDEILKLKTSYSSLKKEFTDFKYDIETKICKVTVDNMEESNRTFVQCMRMELTKHFEDMKEQRTLDENRKTNKVEIKIKKKHSNEKNEIYLKNIKEIKAQ